MPFCLLAKEGPPYNRLTAWLKESILLAPPLKLGVNLFFKLITHHHCTFTFFTRLMSMPGSCHAHLKILSSVWQAKPRFKTCLMRKRGLIIIIIISCRKIPCHISTAVHTGMSIFSITGNCFLSLYDLLICCLPAGATPSCTTRSAGIWAVSQANWARGFGPLLWAALLFSTLSYGTAIPLYHLGYCSRTFWCVFAHTILAACIGNLDVVSFA